MGKEGPRKLVFPGGGGGEGLVDLPVDPASGREKLCPERIIPVRRGLVETQSYMCFGTHRGRAPPEGKDGGIFKR